MKLKKQVLGYFAFTLTGIAAAGLLSLISLISAPVIAQQASVAIDNDDIGGIVRGPGGPEAGVWVYCGDHRIANEIRQDRCDRRPGPLCDSRPAAERELRGLR